MSKNKKTIKRGGIPAFYKIAIPIFVLALVSLILVILNIRVNAAINPQINYQGRLLASSGAPVADGSYNLRFSLYTTSSGGSAIWTETRCYSSDNGTTCTGSGTDQRISVSRGLFSVMLGELSSLSSIDFNQTLYLGVTLGGSGSTPSWGTEFSPRKKLSSTPTAFEAKQLQGKTWEEPGQIGLVTPNTGKFTITNMVGFGSAVSGTGTLTTSGTTVSCATTCAFMTELYAGDKVTISGQTRTVATAPTSNTSFAITTAFSPEISSATAFTYQKASLVAASSTGTASFIVDQSGNIGIGTLTPEEKLHIEKSGDADTEGMARILQSGISTDGRLTGLTIGKSLTAGASAILGYRYDTTAGDEAAYLKIYGDAAPLGFYVRKGGNVGVGTSAPSSLLHLSGASPEFKMDVSGGNYTRLAKSSTLNQTSQYNQILGVTGGNDSYTKLLAHMNSDFSDSATSKTPTYSGATINTSIKKFGAGSGYFNGGSYLSYPDSEDFNFGTGDFTIDWWEYPTASSVRWGTSNTNYSGVYVNSSTVSMSSSGSSFDVASGKALGTQVLNEWHHYAIVRNGNTFYTFKDGVQADTWTSSSAIRNETTPLSIGRGMWGGISYYYTGYYDEFRISKGTARWTGGSNGTQYFTPPTTEYSTSLIEKKIWDSQDGSGIYDHILQFGDTATKITYEGYTHIFDINNSEKMRINSNGNIGIGTSSPLVKLDLLGSARFAGTATSVLTGSIDPTASTTVTGVGTKFTTELVVGDRITVTGVTKTVTAISSDTSLTVDTAFTDLANDTSPDKLAAIFVVRSSSETPQMLVNDIGNVGVGTVSATSKFDIVASNYSSGLKFSGTYTATSDGVTSTGITSIMNNGGLTANNASTYTRAMYLESTNCVSGITCIGLEVNASLSNINNAPAAMAGVRAAFYGGPSMATVTNTAGVAAGKFVLYNPYTTGPAFYDNYDYTQAAIYARVGDVNNAFSNGTGSGTSGTDPADDVINAYSGLFVDGKGLVVSNTRNVPGANGLAIDITQTGTLTTDYLFSAVSGSTSRFFIRADGNIGIGTTSPQSALHVADGKYAQFEDNNAGAPATADCDSNTERGRISIDTSNNRLYICNGATRGWDYIALTD